MVNKKCRICKKIQKVVILPDYNENKKYIKDKMKCWCCPTCRANGHRIVYQEGVYPCPICGVDSMISTQPTLDSCIGCEECDQWFHQLCVPVNERPKRNVWYCMSCKRKQQEENQLQYFKEEFLPGKSNFSISFQNGTFFKCTKSLIVSSELDLSSISEISVPKNLNITQDEFIDVLFGEFNIPIDKLFHFFLLFSYLKMKKRMFLICKELETIENGNTLLVMFQKAKEEFEKKTVIELEEIKEGEDVDIEMEDRGSQVLTDEEEERIEIQSVFTFTLLGLIKKFFSGKDPLQLPKLFHSFFLDPICSKMLKEYKDAPIQSHKDLRDLESENIPRMSSHYDAFLLDSKRLFIDKKYFNLFLKSNDGRIFSANGAVLIHNSKFLFKKIKNVSCKEIRLVEDEFLEVVEVKELNKKEFAIYLKFLYTKEIEENIDLKFLISLFNFAEIFKELEFKGKLFNKIKGRTKEYFAEIKSARNFLYENGYLFKNSENTQLLVDYWKINNIISEEEMKFLIRASKNTYFLRNQNKKKDEKIKTLKRKIFRMKRKRKREAEIGDEERELNGESPSKKRKIQEEEMEEEEMEEEEKKEEKKEEKEDIPLDHQEIDEEEGEEGEDSISIFGDESFSFYDQFYNQSLFSRFDGVVEKIKELYDSDNLQCLECQKSIQNIVRSGNMFWCCYNCFYPTRRSKKHIFKIFCNFCGNWKEGSFKGQSIRKCENCKKSKKLKKKKNG